DVRDRAGAQRRRRAGDLVAARFPNPIPEVRTICVVGAGLMGWQIGLMCARAGYAVHQTDVRQEALEQARQRQRQTLDEWNAAGKLGMLDATGESADAIMARFHQFTSLAEALEGADFVVEAAT